MAHYHEPPAKLTEAEWENIAKVFAKAKQTPAFEMLRESKNKPKRAGDLFEPEDVRVRGQNGINRELRKINSVFSLSRTDEYAVGKNDTPPEDRMLALVRRPEKPDPYA